VCVRIRPLLGDDETAAGSAWRADPGPPALIVPLDESTTPFPVDRAFGPDVSTDELYSAALGRIARSVAAEGVHGTVLAYGQTASGKTHTMTAVASLALEDVFSGCASLGSSRAMGATGAGACRREVTSISVAYVEIYNEEVRDLLSSADGERIGGGGEDGGGSGGSILGGSTGAGLQVQELPCGGVAVPGLTEAVVQTAAEAAALLRRGNDRRKVGGTDMNARSSRSHAVFRLTVESRPIDDDANPAAASLDGGSALPPDKSKAAVWRASLVLCDLAGSERVRKTGATGERLREGAAINRSLGALARVVARLAEGTGAGHVPYRDSKLTRLLRPHLGGRARTCLIAHVSPSRRHADETRETLRFALRASRIAVHAETNVVNTDDDDKCASALRARLRRQQAEIERLRAKLGLGLVGGNSGEGGLASGSLGDVVGSADAGAGLAAPAPPARRRATLCPAADGAVGTALKRMRHEEVSGSRGGMPVHGDGGGPDRGSGGPDAAAVAAHVCKYLRVALPLSTTGTGGSTTAGGNHLDPLGARVAVLGLAEAEARAARAEAEADALRPALAEARWRVRSLEGGVETAAATADDTASGARAWAEAETLAKMARAEADADAARVDAAREAEASREATRRADALVARLAAAEAGRDEAMRAVNDHRHAAEAASKERDLASRALDDALAEADRLRAHTRDLESRRRAPLYQKKQEAELAAAMAAETEARTKAEVAIEAQREAERRAREAEEARDAATTMAMVESDAARAAAEAEARQRRRADAAEAGRLEADTAAAREREGWARDRAELEAEVAEARRAEMEAAECRDAAATRVSELEEEAATAAEAARVARRATAAAGDSNATEGGSGRGGSKVGGGDVKELARLRTALARAETVAAEATKSRIAERSARAAAEREAKSARAAEARTERERKRLEGRAAAERERGAAFERAKGESAASMLREEVSREAERADRAEQERDAAAQRAATAEAMAEAARIGAVADGRSVRREAGSATLVVYLALSAATTRARARAATSDRIAAARARERDEARRALADARAAVDQSQTAAAAREREALDRANLAEACLRRALADRDEARAALSASEGALAEARNAEEASVADLRAAVAGANDGLAELRRAIQEKERELEEWRGPRRAALEARAAEAEAEAEAARAAGAERCRELEEALRAAGVAAEAAEIAAREEEAEAAATAALEAEAAWEERWVAREAELKIELAVAAENATKAAARAVAAESAVNEARAEAKAARSLAAEATAATAAATAAAATVASAAKASTAAADAPAAAVAMAPADADTAAREAALLARVAAAEDAARRERRATRRLLAVRARMYRELGPEGGGRGVTEDVVRRVEAALLAGEAAGRALPLVETLVAPAAAAGKGGKVGIMEQKENLGEN